MRSIVSVPVEVRDTTTLKDCINAAQYREDAVANKRAGWHADNELLNGKRERLKA